MKFRRKAEPTQAPDGPDAVRRPPRRRGRAAAPTGTGPFDESEVADDGVERVDLGSLLVAPTPGSRAAAPGRRADRQVQAVMLAGPDGALELRAFAAPRNGDLWTRCARRSPPTSPGAAAPPPSARAASAPSWSCQLPVQRPDGTTGDPAVADHRRQRRALDAARHAPRPARARARGRRRVGGRARAGRRTPRRPRHARRRAAAGRAARAGAPGQLSAMPDTAGPPRTAAGCGAASRAGPTREDQHARDLRKTHATAAGETCIADAPDRERVRLRGTVKTVTLRPRGGVPALEAELYDGTGVLTDRLARPAPDRRHGPGALDARRGPDRRPPATGSCTTRATS